MCGVRMFVCEGSQVVCYGKLTACRYACYLCCERDGDGTGQFGAAVWMALERGELVSGPPLCMPTFEGRYASRYCRSIIAHVFLRRRRV